MIKSIDLDGDVAEDEVEDAVTVWCWPAGPHALADQRPGSLDTPAAEADASSEVDTTHDVVGTVVEWLDRWR